MILSIIKKEHFYRRLCWMAAISVALSCLLPSRVGARPGLMARTFEPPVLCGLKTYPQEPFRFEFLLDKGDEARVQDVSERLIKYFLTSLTIPEKDLWVNLSPAEPDRIVEKDFGRTGMGQELLALDLVLKQMTAALLTPQGETGRAFWDKVYTRLKEKYGTAEISVDDISKVWITPGKVVVYEHNASALIMESSLKVMAESDYLTREKVTGRRLLENMHDGLKATGHQLPASGSTDIVKRVLNEIIIPEVEKEVNTGANFAPLRQVYHSLILAAWYKRRLKEGLLARSYVDQKKIFGVEKSKGALSVEVLYQQYLDAYREGLKGTIVEGLDQTTGEVVPRKYIAGGVNFDMSGLEVSKDAEAAQARAAGFSGDLVRLAVLARPAGRDMAQTTTGNSPERIVFRPTGELGADPDALAPIEGEAVWPEISVWGVNWFDEQLRPLLKERIPASEGTYMYRVVYYVIADLVQNAFRRSNNVSISSRRYENGFIRVAIRQDVILAAAGRDRWPVLRANSLLSLDELRDMDARKREGLAEKGGVGLAGYVRLADLGIPARLEYARDDDGPLTTILWIKTAPAMREAPPGVLSFVPGRALRADRSQATASVSSGRIVFQETVPLGVDPDALEAAGEEEAWPETNYWSLNWFWEEFEPMLRDKVKQPSGQPVPRNVYVLIGELFGNAMRRGEGVRASSRQFLSDTGDVFIRVRIDQDTMQPTKGKDRWPVLEANSRLSWDDLKERERRKANGLAEHWGSGLAEYAKLHDEGVPLRLEYTRNASGAMTTTLWIKADPAQNTVSSLPDRIVFRETAPLGVDPDMLAGAETELILPDTTFRTREWRVALERALLKVDRWALRGASTKIVFKTMDELIGNASRYSTAVSVRIQRFFLRPEGVFVRVQIHQDRVGNAGGKDYWSILDANSLLSWVHLKATAERKAVGLAERGFGLSNYARLADLGIPARLEYVKDGKGGMTTILWIRVSPVPADEDVLPYHNVITQTDPTHTRGQLTRMSRMAGIDTGNLSGNFVFIGFGQGLGGIYTAARMFPRMTIVGVDISRKMVAEARKEIERAEDAIKSRIKIRHLDARHMKPGDILGEAQIIYYEQVFNLMYDNREPERPLYPGLVPGQPYLSSHEVYYRAMLESAYTSLTPGGLLFVDDAGALGLIPGIFRDAGFKLLHEPVDTETSVVAGKPDPAQGVSRKKAYGGIDFDTDKVNMDIHREVRSVSGPDLTGPPALLMNISGLLPVVMRITPAGSLGDYTGIGSR
jgi:SAM-dependent methyltransferase